MHTEVRTNSTYDPTEIVDTVRVIDIFNIVFSCLDSVGDCKLMTVFRFLLFFVIGRSVFAIIRNYHFNCFQFQGMTGCPDSSLFYSILLMHRNA